MNPTNECQTLNLREAAQVLGISYSAACDLVRKDEFPVPVLKVGRRAKVSRAAMERFLGNQDHAASSE